jgi:1-acyl-sn-glycerol-3-phosphate acyltransferase
VWRTIGFVAYFWPLLFATTVVYLPAAIFALAGSRHLSRRLLETTVRLWSLHMLQLLGARVTVCGRENVPRHNRVCIVSNHQSLGDSLMIQGHLGKIAGFIAKRELASVPVLGIWMRVMGCPFVQRRNPRSARRALALGARRIAGGRPMVVFPEGTRSRGGPVAEFKAGALRLALDSQATIVPVTIEGTADLLEKQGYLQSGEVRMTIHPPITPSEYASMTKQELAKHLRTLIAGAMRRHLQAK